MKLALVLEKNLMAEERTEDSESRSQRHILTAIEFICCFIALQASYLVWGVLQESIMTTKFNPTPAVPSGMFPSPVFCVFSNRVLALAISAIIALVKHGKVTSATSLVEYIPCALSNTVSSWSQYSALSYVSFSLQTLFKSTKVIPVMIMGRLLKGVEYSLAQYLEAILITVGVAVFSLDPSKSSGQKNVKTEVLGVVMLSLYVLSDSFTSQWQSRLYRNNSALDQFHMMFGVNLAAILFTTATLIVEGDIPVVTEFFMANPLAVWYNVITAITSATGQLAIFYTIKRFGPIVFTIIMTTRQMMSIVLSNIIFGHEMKFQSYVGALIVFSAIFHSIYREVRDKTSKSRSGGNRVSESNQSGKFAEKIEEGDDSETSELIDKSTTQVPESR